MGNCATGCHFRPYSFASSSFDDFAEMKNSTRKNVCQHLVGPSPWQPPDHRKSRPCRIEKGAGEEASRQPVSAKSAPQATKETTQHACANQRRGHCIRNPRRKYLRKSPAAAKLSAPPSCSRSIPHPPVLRFPSPTHPISPHFARIVGQHSHLSANNCIETSLISVIETFMQLYRLQIAITYLLSIWQAFGHVRALRPSFAQPSFKNTFA